MSLFEVNQAASIIKEAAHPDVNLIFGAVINEEMGDQIRITVIATGFDPSVPVRKVARATVEQRVQPTQPRTAQSPAGAKMQGRGETRRKPVDPFDLDLPTFLRKR
jgi:cell division protein FtsZ